MRFFEMPKFTKANDYFENFLISQNIITSTITTITIPTQTPALKIAPIAWQLLRESMISTSRGIRLSLNLFIMI
jgi:hypothetical protein